jgi:hypothetical protein
MDRRIPPFGSARRRIGGIRRRLVAASLVAALASAVCSHASAAPPVVPDEQALAANVRTLQAAGTHLERVGAELTALRTRGGWRDRGFFDATETDEIEYLLFRFLAVHTALWDLVAAHGGVSARFPESESGTKAHVAALSAQLLLAYHTSFLVAAFIDDPVAVREMNQAFPRSDVPRDTYDTLRRRVTATGYVQAVAGAGQLHAADMASPTSPVRILAASDPAYRRLIDDLPRLHAGAAAHMQTIATHDGHSAALENALSHSEVATLTRSLTEKLGDARYAARSMLFKDVSRVKSPSAHLITFSDSQKQRVLGLLEPGDVILTYTAGYMSDVFIPGRFKHGITYVGTPHERLQAHMTPAAAPRAERYEPKRLAENLQTASLPGGRNANVIEAVAEGVIFNNLEHLMDTHINRLLVLRPRLDTEERAAFVVEVFSYLGDGYDFRFDFADPSEQVCTEVIYRALNRRGSIDLPLVTRAGHETLSADDVVNYHLRTNPDAFEIILLAEEDPAFTDHRARILVGLTARLTVEALMAKVH